MGDLDSSLTRVQPVFDALLDRAPNGIPWLRELWDLAALTRPGVAVARQGGLGKLVPEETPRDKASRRGKVYERPVAPPAAFLRWLLEHPDRMEVRDPVTFGAKSETVQHWRAKLFSGDEPRVAEARDEGLTRLGMRLAQRGRNKWWAFEGFTRVDACLVSTQAILFVEGKRTERVSSSTMWFPNRNQLWRNVEAAKELASGKQFGVILAVEHEADGVAALDTAAESLDASYPHLDSDARAELARHLLGFVTWPGLTETFDLPPTRDALRDALELAGQKHAGQVRKDEAGTPYIGHIHAVVDVLRHEGGVSDEAVLVAAALHDTVEDTDTTFEDIEAAFGKEVAGLVRELTDDKSLPKEERKRLQIEHAPTASPKARQLKIADKIANVRDVGASPAAGWSQARRLEYLDWAERVVAGCRGVNPRLDEAFDAALKAARDVVTSAGHR